MAPSFVDAFLEQNGLGQYREKFASNGFEDLEMFFVCTEDDLSQLGMLVGHRRKLLLAIQKQFGPKAGQLAGKADLLRAKVI